jgi:2,3-bisphosphoglycerate-independent phosphoglycerate mutase
MTLAATTATAPARRPQPVVLCILDGWGWREARDNNAIALADTQTFNRLWANNPHGLLDASENHVGLPTGQMGNSEVGHITIGGGRVLFQQLPRLDKEIAEGGFFTNPALVDLIARTKAAGGTLHILGLASPGGVHSHQDHIVAAAKAGAEAGLSVAIHAFLDGRDVPPQSAKEQIAELLKAIAPLKGVRLATLCGRYYAMDRDKRWERVEKAYRLLVDGESEKPRTKDALAAIAASYADGVTDEFVLPVALDEYRGMADGDGLLMINFRADRAREILTALLDENFTGFARPRVVKFSAALGTAEYSAALNPLIAAMYPNEEVHDGLGEIVAKAGLRQLRIAETEKYPHVTFFLNGGREEVYAGEDRVLVPSPKVATYDLKPEMAAAEVTDKLVAAIEGGTYDLIVVNYANPDMVGHTGVLSAAIAAAKTIDACLARLEAAVKAAGGAMFITADHGNLEQMLDADTGAEHTAHTLNLVPAILVNGPADIAALGRGSLADIAPTILDVMGIEQPRAMTGRSLLRGAHAAEAAE